MCTNKSQLDYAHNIYNGKSAVLFSMQFTCTGIRKTTKTATANICVEHDLFFLANCFKLLLALCLQTPEIKIFHDMSVVFKQLQFIHQEVRINCPTNVRNVNSHDIKPFKTELQYFKCLQINEIICLLCSECIIQQNQKLNNLHHNNLN